MRSTERVALWTALAVTGFSALALQVVWQRVISLHAGADVISTATVVSGFLAGIGFGSLIGGRFADRLSRRMALRVFAAAEAGVALFAMASLWVFYDLYARLAPSLGGTALGFLVNFAFLLVPTSLMGLSLPMAARAVTERAESAGGQVGWLYSLNTAGGALGAFVCGWHLLGRFGFVTTTWICAALGVFASAILVVLSLGPTLPTETVPDTDREGAPAPGMVAVLAPVWHWYLLYAFSGALALGLQQAFFRLVGAIGRSNSYSFATVLGMYLAVFAIGAAVGARFVGRTSDPRKVFLWLQFGVGALALSSLVVLTEVLAPLGLADRFAEWFNSDGFASGYDQADRAEVLIFAVGLPLLLVAPPVALMGASFPFVERVVVDRLGTIGRRTGGLLAANTFGNVVGVLVAGFVLFDLVGTAGTYRVITGFLLLAGLLAAALSAPRRRWLFGSSALAVAVALLWVSPSNLRLWEFLSGDDGGNGLMLAEDSACASVIERNGIAEFQLNINGATQNGYPFDDFHVLIGLLPSLLADDPGHGLAVGFGIGSTSFALLADERREQVTTVELCGGHYVVTDQLAVEGHDEFVALRDDPRHDAVVGDGRNHLLQIDDGRHDVVVVDTLRITSAYSGQHFSKEFYELAARALTDEGVFAQWVPTWRALNSAAQVFPHLVTMKVASYGDSVFMLASRNPITTDPDELVNRFDRHAAEAFPSEQQERLRSFLAEIDPTCVTDGVTATDVPSEFENTDLSPRDEFHRNNGFIGETQTTATCGDAASAPEGSEGG